MRAASICSRSQQIYLIMENIICPFTILNVDLTQEELLNNAGSINNTAEIIQALETFTWHSYLKTFLSKVYEIHSSTCLTSNILGSLPETLLYFNHSSFKSLIKWTSSVIKRICAYSNNKQYVFHLKKTIKKQRCQNAEMPSRD